MKNYLIKFMIFMGIGVILSALDPAFCQDNKVVYLKKGDTLKSTSVTMGSYIFLKVKINDQAEQDCSWDFSYKAPAASTLAEDKFEFYGQVYKYENGNQIPDGRAGLVSPLGAEPLRPVAPDAFSLEFKRQVDAWGTVYTEYITGNFEVIPPAGVDVYVYYSQGDAIIHQNAAARYPQVSFITIVAIESLPDGTKKLYDGSNGYVYLKIKNLNSQANTKQKTPFQVINLTSLGLELSEIKAALFGNGGSLSWKGFYHALGSADAGTLSSALSSSIAFTSLDNSGPEEVSVQIDNDKGHCVIAVVDWNYTAELKNLDFTISEDIASVPTRGIPQNISVALNADNVDFVREKLENVGNLTDALPNFREQNYYPGKFIIKGTQAMGDSFNRLYSNIIEIKRQEARSNGAITVEGGGGSDWPQVAAADICDGSSQVLNTVLGIQAASSKFSGEYISPNIVTLNPYDKVLRNNSRADTTYTFYYNRSFVSTVEHEAYHGFIDTYSRLYKYLKLNNLSVTGLPFYDIDQDKLKVKGIGDNSQAALIYFTWDHEKRGFVGPLINNEAYVRWAYNARQGNWGDEDAYPRPAKSTIVMRLDDKLTRAQLEAMFSLQDQELKIQTNIPSDLPHPLIATPRPLGVWILANKQGPLFVKQLLPSSDAKEESIALIPQGIEVSTTFGGYTRYNYLLKIKTLPNMNNPFMANFAKTDAFKNSNFELYAVFEINYSCYTEEFDAATYGIFLGPRTIGE